MRHVEHVMGTVVSFDVRRGRAGRRAEAAAIERACATLHDADDTFSLYKPESPMSRLRRGDITVEQAPPDVAIVLQHCATARDLSGGWFDPWALPDGLDPTGLVKGWATQRAADTLKAAGMDAAMVNGAGDIACFGQPEPGRPWTVGVMDPYDATAIAFTVPVTHAIATSGVTQRGEHIYDVHRREYGARLASATVLGPDLAIADALATALAARGPGKALVNAPSRRGASRS
jgi:thiamine biosynthesis lipoprotein